MAFENDYYDYLDILDEEDENEEAPEVVRMPKRYNRNVQNSLEFFTDEQFRIRFRFAKQTVVNILLPLIEEPLLNTTQRGLPIAPILSLLICLRFYATGNFQMVSGDLTSVHQSTISRIVKRVSISLAEKSAQFIHFPRAENEQRQNIARFYNIAHFPSVIGCIDCTHVAIENPRGDNAEVFRNRKAYFSLNVQIVAGPHMEILNIVVRHPRSTHDNVIFEQSALRVQFERGDTIGLLLGDNGYACKPYLLTPVIHPDRPEEQNYNRAHIRTRNIVERLFEIWKKKFPCLTRKLLTKIPTNLAIICGTAVLHISRAQGDVDEEEQNEILGNIEGNYNGKEELGLNFRRRFIQQHFNSKFSA